MAVRGQVQRHWFERSAVDRGTAGMWAFWKVAGKGSESHGGGTCGRVPAGLDGCAGGSVGLTWSGGLPVFSRIATARSLPLSCQVRRLLMFQSPRLEEFFAGNPNR